jgi:alkyldihydroxyacetonephosphate synthase
MKYNSPDIERLKKIFGPDRVSVRPDDLAIYSRDVYPVGELWTRRGEVRHRPDCVVWLEEAGEVSEILKLANETMTPIVPYGGGSGVCGGAIPLEGGIALDLKRMDRIRNIDHISMSAEIEAGAVGELLERRLNETGCTLGHFPSSIYCSTLGGWLAARSAGQLSSKYGKIEDMTLSLEAVLPDGSIIRTNDAPREATGPDIDQILIGSEGALAVITAATMKLNKLPEIKAYAAFLMPYFTNGVASLRLLMRSEVVPAVARLYDEVDSKIALSKQKIEGTGCLLVLLFDGYPDRVRWETDTAWSICMREGGKDLGQGPARHWEEHRYSISYKQSQVLSAPGSLLDTIELATTWSNLANLYNTVRMSLEGLCLVMAHVSHIYIEGAAIYFTCVARPEDESPEERYKKIWDAAMAAARECGATLSHHHGVGYLKGPYMAAQMGPLMDIYRELKKQLDPNNILNPGKMGL